VSINAAMNDLSVGVKFVLAVLATWRITHLLVNEDGPADLIVRVRARLGSGFVGNLMDCFYCLSMWIAAPFAGWVGGQVLDLLLIWLALSGAACLLERIGQQPIVYQPIAGENERSVNHGMLWPETNEPQE
jgi:hypothetical protein